MIVILGAGTAGLTARREIARITDDYVIIDPGKMGTTCARVGCMPSKALIQIANDYHRRQKWEKTGIHGGENLSINLPEVMNHVRRLRDRFTGGVLKSMNDFEDKIIRKRAKFLDSNTLDLEGEKLQFTKAVIATGSSPFIPDDWTAYSEYIMTTDEFFEKNDFPKKMAVIGMGVIGLEIGQAMARLGVEVIAFGNRKTLGGAQDPQINKQVFQAISKELQFVDGMAIPIGRSANGQLIIEANNQEYHVDQVIMAVGRRPNHDLGLETLGIDLDEKGMPELDQKTFALKQAPHIYFVGDVNGVRPLLHEAADQGFIAGKNAASKENDCYQQRTPIGITFSDPNIATVGKRFNQLHEYQENLCIGRTSLKSQGRALTKLSAIGEMAIYCHKESGLLLGAELFCPDAEHLAHLLSLAVSQKMTVFNLLTMPFYHPVIEEGLRNALRHAASQTLPAQTNRIEELQRCMDTPSELT